MTINGEDPNFTFPERHAKIDLVVNDSFAYLHKGKKGKPLYKDTDSSFGKKARHHDFFYDSYSKLLFHYSAYPHPSRPVLVVDSARSVNMIVLEDSVYAFNMLCRKAHLINAKNDTMYAVVAYDIKSPYGPFGYTGLSGLILELYNFKTGEHTIIKSIRNGNYVIRIPSIKRRYLYPNTDR